MLSNSEKETFKIAEDFSKTIKGGDIILLYGDLGSGKTTFMKGVAVFFGINQDKIISPTFTIFNKYKIKNNNIHNIIHIDAYRIESNEEFLETGALEYFGDENTIVFIEWPSKIGDFISENNKKIEFKFIDNNSREIKIKN